MKAVAENRDSFSCSEQVFTIVNYKKFDHYNEYDPFYIRRVDFTNDQCPPRIVIYAQSGSCLRCKRIYATQDIEEVRATMLTQDGRRIDNINLHYCRNCSFFFIDSVSLNQYNIKFGKLFCIQDKSYFYGYLDDGPFNVDSVLSRNGYKADGSMSTEKRQEVIKTVLESGQATKNEIISLLSSFIRTRWERCPGACSRWEVDLRFVNNYNIQNERYIGTIVEQEGSLFRV